MYCCVRLGLGDLVNLAKSSGLAEVESIRAACALQLWLLPSDIPRPQRCGYAHSSAQIELKGSMFY